MRPLLCLLTAAIPLAHAASPNMELAKSVFDPRVMSNAEESPIPGLYQFAQGTEVFYISADGRYVMQGEMIDLQTQNNVTEAFRASERAKALTQIDPKTMISVMPNAPQYQVTVFIDVDCPYCRVMQQNILEYTQRGIAIRYLAFPRSGPESIAALRMSQVWCSPNRLSALLLAETDQPLPNSRGDCTNIIRDHFATGLQMGIASTPSVILEDGTLIPGFVAPANLEAILSQHLRQRETPPEPRSPVRRPPPPLPLPPPGAEPAPTQTIPDFALSVLATINAQTPATAKLQTQAEHGDASAQYRLGQHYAAAQNLAEAKKWYEKAAAQGYAEAAYKLGRLYDDAHDRNKAGQYYETARRQWEKAATAGDADAQYQLGVLCREGLGIAADPAQARAWFEKAAAQGHEAAKAALE